MGKGYNQESEERKLLEGEMYDRCLQQIREKDTIKKARKENC
jgi:hypothetical protein